MKSDNNATLNSNNITELTSNNDGELKTQEIDVLPIVMDVDELLRHIGELGKSQLILLFLLSLLMIPTAYQSLSMTFIAINPSWVCANLSEECNRTEVFSVNDEFYDRRCFMKRESWRYVKDNDFSIVTEWDLICDKINLKYMANSGLQIGAGIGTILLGFMSDRYGRKRMLFPAFAVFIVVSFVTAFVHSFWIFFTLRVITGILQGGIYLAIWILMSESLGLNYRSYSNALWCAYTVGMCLMALQSWLVSKWRVLVILLSAPYLILMGTYSFIPESVRWLRLNNHTNAAEKILRQVAKCNKKPWPNATLSSVSEDSKDRKTSYKYVFYPWKVLLSTSVQFLFWFGNGISYYGISFASESLSNNIYRDFVLISIVDIPSNLIVSWFCNRFGRKQTSILTAVVGGLLIIILAFIPFITGSLWVPVTIAMVAKFFVNLSYSGVYIWSTEIYPTSIRSQGIAVCTWAALLGAAMAPWVSPFLVYFHSALPFSVIGSVLIISGLCCCILPETNGILTVEVVED